VKSTSYPLYNRGFAVAAGNGSSRVLPLVGKGGFVGSILFWKRRSLDKIGASLEC
jgi:hypothetical protein